MLRIYFLHHRELLGALSLAADQTVKELMALALLRRRRLLSQERIEQFEALVRYMMRPR